MKPLNLFGDTFGSCLDVSHGDKLTEQQELQLRFLALFSKKIVVPDTFFHCYGPIFLHAHAKASCDPKGEDVKEDILLGLIAHGVIVPALRNKFSGEGGLYKNFTCSDIRPGTFQYPTKEEAKKALKFLDKLSKGRKHEIDWKPDLSLRTFEALKYQFLRLSLKELKESFAEKLGLWKTPEDLWVPQLTAFRTAIKKQAGQGYFQRGPLEIVLAEQLKVERRDVYNKFGALSKSHPTHRILHYLLSEMITYYQISQGHALRTVPTVSYKFSGHEITNGALVKAMNRRNFPKSRAWVSFDQILCTRTLMSLSVAQIMELREGAVRDFRAALSDSLIMSTDAQSNQTNYRKAQAKFVRRMIEKTKKGKVSPWLRAFLALTGPAANYLMNGIDSTEKFAVSAGLAVIAAGTPDAKNWIQNATDRRKLSYDLNNFFLEI